MPLHAAVSSIPLTLPPHLAQLASHRCGIPAANATYSSTVPPGGCILSCDDVKDRQVLFLAYGDSVPFMAGQYNPQNTTAPPTNSSTGGGLGTGGGGIPGGISPSVRRLLQGGIGTISSVWTNYTYDQVLLGPSWSEVGAASGSDAGDGPARCGHSVVAVASTAPAALQVVYVAATNAHTRCPPCPTEPLQPRDRQPASHHRADGGAVC